MRWLLIPMVLLLAACSTPPTPPGPTTPLSFTGFQSEWSDPSAMDASAEAMTVLAVDGLNVLPEGGGLTEPNPDVTTLLERAHAAGLDAELMVGNFSSEIDDFDEQRAFDTLSSPAARAGVIATLSTIVERDGWDGISIDLESLAPRDADGLTAFATELRKELAPDKSISIALMLGDPAERGTDLEALVPVIDRFILMAYDEHGPWDAASPGPVGSLDWQRAGLEVLLDDVPADHVELGVAGYGYGWGPSGDGQLSVERAQELAGDDARFDEAAGEWTAQLDDGTELWWSDIRSFRLRVEMARDAGIAGVALWSLEQGDPITPADLE